MPLEASNSISNDLVKLGIAKIGTLIKCYLSYWKDFS